MSRSRQTQLVTKVLSSSALPFAVLAAFLSYLAIAAALSGPSLRQEGQLEEQKAVQAQKRDFLEPQGSMAAAEAKVEQRIERILESAQKSERETGEHHLPETRTAAKLIAELDEEWKRFPRSTFSFPRALVERGGTLQPSELYRHKTLNPADVFVPKVLRQQLEQAMLRYRKSIAKSRMLGGLLATKELNLLIKAGRATATSTREAIRNLPPADRAIVERESARIRQAIVKAAGPGAAALPPPTVIMPSILYRNRPMPAVFSGRGDKIYSAVLGELPLARRSAKVFGFLTMEMGGAIAIWFREHCNLSEGQLVKLLAEAAALLDEKTK